MKKLLYILIVMSCCLVGCSHNSQDDLPKSVKKNVDEQVKLAKQQGDKYTIKENSVKYDKKSKTLKMEIDWKLNIDVPDRIGEGSTYKFAHNDLIQKVEYKYDYKGKEQKHLMKKNKEDEFKFVK
ncbi:hypothetical protein WL555_08425 [Staphylococcus warneri]|uniref:hypothetical protein n=1 Tax=Staphylococcus TaxID=1279 RepID=UPI0006405C89|nr:MULTISPECIES: hypothetical protein [Staphylococcus]KTW19586.1 hypothetical protein SA9_05045 [Staphylococcus warneri]KTW23026.1 hypothetical protein SA10R_06930 [Staphylococcus warneri]MCG7305983.1 hypothetical protein [Staphylococcus warneri]MCM3483382.1 hypothetical protein [Staphylococcus warneri]MCR4501620.1 hypothetical protein [Staphylococcus warneri]